MLSSQRLKKINRYWLAMNEEKGENLKNFMVVGLS